MAAGGLTGFIFRYLAERAKERAEIYKMAIGMKKAQDDSADKAAKRVSVDAGKSDNFLNLFLMGFPFTKPHRYLSKEPNSSCTLRNCFALFIAELILSLFRIMDSSCSNFDTRF